MVIQFEISFRIFKTNTNMFAEILNYVKTLTQSTTYAKFSWVDYNLSVVASPPF